MGHDQHRRDSGRRGHTGASGRSTRRHRQGLRQPWPGRRVCPARPIRTIVGRRQAGAGRRVPQRGWLRAGQRLQCARPRAMIQNIAQHGAGGGAFTGTRAAQHNLIDRITFDHHHIGAALPSCPSGESAGTRQGVMRCSSPRAVALRHTQELDPVAHVGGMADVIHARCAGYLRALHRQRRVCCQRR